MKDEENADVEKRIKSMKEKVCFMAH